MRADEIAAILDEVVPGAVRQRKLDALDPFVIVEPARLPEVCRALRDDERLRFEMLNCISGVDYLEPDPKKAAKAGFEPHLEVVYHFSSISLGHRFVVKVILPRWKDDVPGQLPEVPSVESIYRTADWHEREVYDLCGVMFTGRSGLQRILTAEDWEGHPLRKDYEFPLEYHGIRGR